MRRWEILLPLRFNDGSRVPHHLVESVILSLRDRFGAASFETQTIRGIWEHEDDDVGRLFADVPDTPENREWFIQFKERLKKDFQQSDIWMVTHPVEVV
jgi:hypothetical protein